MRGKSSSSSPKSKNGILETESIENLSESHLSGAYIRSLVKQLSSSRTKGHETSEGQVISGTSSANMSCSIGFSDHGSKQEKPHQPPKQHKKQVRRRLHTSRPYQERLLNMAEARREIVTALKFHRAAMKKAREEDEKQQKKTESGLMNQPFDPSPDEISSQEHDGKFKSWRNPRIYDSNYCISNEFPSNFSDNFSYSPGIYAPCSYSMPLVPPPPPLIQDNLNFPLPNQTLGLNLNLQDFNDLVDTSAFNCGNNNTSSIYSSSSSASTSSPSVSTYTEETPCVVAQGSVAAEFENPGLHYAIDDKEMNELRSMGELYQMEWNDTMNLVNSAWWFKFLNGTEKETRGKGGDDLVNNSMFDEVMEFPAWLNANDECCVNDDCVQDPTLPCMDIEEIEGMDVDWLA